MPLVFSSGPTFGVDPFLPGSQHTAGHCDSVEKHINALLQQVEGARVSSRARPVEQAASQTGLPGTWQGSANSLVDHARLVALLQLTHLLALALSALAEPRSCRPASMVPA